MLFFQSIHYYYIEQSFTGCSSSSTHYYNEESFHTKLSTIKWNKREKIGIFFTDLPEKGDSICSQCIRLLSKKADSNGV